MSEFPERLAKRLTTRGSKKALAIAAGVEPRMISHYLQGTKSPSVQTMERIAEHFGTTPARLWGPGWAAHVEAEARHEPAPRTTAKDVIARLERVERVLEDLTARYDTLAADAATESLTLAVEPARPQRSPRREQREPVRRVDAD